MRKKVVVIAAVALAALVAAGSAWYLSASNAIKAVQADDDVRLGHILDLRPSLVNAKVTDGGSPLLWVAAQHDSKNCARMLLDRGADPNASPSPVNHAGVVSPLTVAVGSGRADLVEMLLERGAAPGKKLARGVSAVHFLGWNKPNADRICKALLASGAHIDAKDEEGNTPLHKAVLGGMETQVERLLKHGANPFVRNAAGKTPRDLAERSPGDARIWVTLLTAERARSSPTGRPPVKD